MAPGNMKVQAVDEDRERFRKRVAIGALSVFSAVVLAGGVFMSWYLTAPALPETPEEAASVMKSARFQRLSDEEKQPYYDVIREQWGMDQDLRRAWREDDDLREASRDMRRQMMDERIDAFMLADAEERAAMMEEGMRGPGGPPRGDRGGEGGGRGEGGRGGEGGRDSAAARDRASDRLGNGNAQRGAARGEMMRSRNGSGNGGGGGGGGRPGG